MSILRYERPDWPPQAPELPAVLDAVLALLATVLGAALLGLASLGMLFGEAAWASVVAAPLLLLILLGSPVAIWQWAVRPMWQRWWRCYSPGALVVMLLGAALLFSWLIAIGEVALWALAISDL